ERKRARGLGGADLDRDDGLAVLTGAARGGEKMRRIGDALDIAEHHPKLRLNRVIIDEVADPQADLSAAGGEVGHLEAKLVDGAVDRGADRAALGGDRDRTFRRLLQGLVRDAGEAALPPGTPHPLM